MCNKTRLNCFTLLFIKLHLRVSVSHSLVNQIHGDEDCLDICVPLHRA